MEEFERRRRREREKHERQQMHSADHEVSLFPAPRRLTHVNDGEDDIAAKLGDFLKAKEFFNSSTVGISASSGHRQPAILQQQQQQQQPHQSSPSPSTLSASVVGANAAAGTQRQPSFVAPTTTKSTTSHHFTNPQQQQQQQHNPSRLNATYLKGAENNNKLPYNGRGMAPPKQPTTQQQTATSGSAAMQPPPTNIIPNGRQSNAPHLGPPSTVPQLQNGRLPSQQKLLSAGVKKQTKIKYQI